MALEAGMTGKELRVGTGWTLEDAGSGAVITATLTANLKRRGNTPAPMRLKWGPTKNQWWSSPRKLTSTAGSELVFVDVPCVDLAGWKYDGQEIDLTDGKVAFTYTLTVRHENEVQTIGPFVVLGTDPAVIDVDGIVDVATTVGGVIGVDLTTPVTESQAAAAAAAASAADAEAAAAAAVAPTDTQVAALVADDGSATAAALSATYGAVLLATDPRVGMSTGSDIASAWSTAMGILETTGGTLLIPAGVWQSATALDPIPSGVTVRGVGYDYADTPALCTVIKASAAMDTLVTVGDAASGSASGTTSGSLRDIVVDGANLADTSIMTQGRRRVLHNVYSRRGLVACIDLAGQNNIVSGKCIVEPVGYGDGMIVRQNPDNKIFGNTDFRGTPATTGAQLHIILDGVAAGGGLDSGDLLLTGLHMWTGANGVATAANALIWLDVSGGSKFHSLNITGCILEGIDGSPIRVTVDGTSSVAGLNVTDNTVFNGSYLTDATHSVVLIEGAGTVTDVVIHDNTIHCKDTSHRYRAILHDAGTGTRGRVVLDGNSGRYVQYPVTRVSGSNLDAAMEMGRNVVLASGSITRRTRIETSQAITGDGSASTFTFSSGLGIPITNWTVTPTGVGISFRNWTMNAVGSTSDNLILAFYDGTGTASAPANGANLGFRLSAVGKPYVV